MDCLNKSISFSRIRHYVCVAFSFRWYDLIPSLQNFRGFTATAILFSSSSFMRPLRQILLSQPGTCQAQRRAD